MKRYILKKKAVAVAGRVLDDMTQSELEEIYLSGDRRFIDLLECDDQEESVISDDTEAKADVIEEEKPTKKKRTSKRKKQEDESE